MGDIDGLDLMNIHSDAEFVRKVRECKRLVYDYRGAERIELTLEDAEALAKLAGLESSITDDLIIGIITKDDAHLKGSQIYQRLANQAGANVIIIDDLDQMP
ncbi:hypothetical protein [Aestuariibacter salexigens]|uniref:hypothetical protein n=1 Tax=Aestuariibacter salexigens TaxID=226010 RepID=UPI00040A0CA5|nr:hypothetical protein [Aestuariibacter salexigens]